MPWPTSAARYRPGAQTQPNYDLEGLYFGSPGSPCWHVFLHGRSADLAGLATYYILFFLHLESGRVTPAGITRHPTEAWITQMARNAVDHTSGGLRQCRYLLHDRDAKFCAVFDEVLASDGIDALKIRPRSPNLNAYTECWVRPVKDECLSKLVLFGERSLQRALTEYLEHYHRERHHGKSNALLFPSPALLQTDRRRGICCRERLGGLLRYYSRAA